jgi:hypothetical protein
MELFLPLIILIILGCIYAGSLNTASSRLNVVLCMLVFIIAICYIQLNNDAFTNSKGYAPINYVLRNNNKTCDGLNYKGINQQISSTGSYDGVKLESNMVTHPLINPVTIFNPVGDGIKLTQPLGNKRFPTVDGQKDSAKHLFTFAYNNVSPDCCGHSNVSSDMGCVCYSPEQLKMIQSRGGNIKEGSRAYPFI